jgi:MoCo/4Fe-4S cofactor protein with predicted Tat translocation signal
MKRDQQYWRSLDELAATDEFRSFVDDEFPNRTLDWNDPASRRRFLQLMGASIALAGASACTKQPKELIVPYVRQPEDVIPGKPLFYATAMSVAGIATGVLVESHLGRPTKIEGNPEHPASLGSTDAAMQASVLTLYDPDRSQTVTRDGNINGWGAFITALTAARDSAATKKGAGFRILTGTVTSPTLGAQLQAFLMEFPEAKWHQYEPCGRHSARAGAIAAFGKSVNTLYRFDRADVIVSLDSDFLCSTTPGSLRYARDYSARRRAAAESSTISPPRLYVAENSPSITGGMADHRFRMTSAAVADFAAAIAKGDPGTASPEVRAVLKDLEAHRGAGIVIAGEYQPPAIHAIAHAMNQTLGNTGKTVIYADPVEANPTDEIASLAELVKDMRAGTVEMLLILGGNPVYDAPADLNFLDALKRVKLRAHLGLYSNETAAWCHWHIPEAHYLESWSDARAYDGTVSIVQPLIMPIYGGKTVHEIVNILINQADQSAHDTVQGYWHAQHPGKDFDDFWQITLHDGVMAGSALRETVPPRAQMPDLGASGAAPEPGLEIVFCPDPSIGDGAMANNAWIQEMPKPQNKMTWDNALWISPKSAGRYGVTTGDVVELDLHGSKIDAPVWIMPGQADESATVHLGYGRTRAGRVADGVGFDAYRLRTTTALWRSVGAKITRKSGDYKFANTQHTQTMEERDPFRASTYVDFHRNPDFARPQDERVPNDLTLFPQWEYKQHKWGMSIDLNSCVGCQACTVACQAENNIPVVGKEEVAKGRHMNWLRVDRYFKGPVDDPELYFQPVPCMHCENAPCELVCPVAATVHSAEGLNEMVYNRCVGTRYCSNNCPYKVRRFNFFLYSDWDTQSLFGVRNPDVSVRSRGVMEKCSYCVQRINAAKIEAEEQNRPVKDGEIVTACQQACPAEAIVFGDLNDPNSRVAKLKRQQRDYGLLEELNTRPRTTYLARLRNPNPDLEKS